MEEVKAVFTINQLRNLVYKNLHAKLGFDYLQFEEDLKTIYEKGIPIPSQ